MLPGDILGAVEDRLIPTPRIAQASFASVSMAAKPNDYYYRRS